MIEHFQNENTEGIITRINASGKHTLVQIARFEGRPDISIMFYTGSPDKENEKNEDGTDRYTDPVFLYLHSVTECKALIQILANIAKDLGGDIEITKEKKE